LQALRHRKARVFPSIPVEWYRNKCSNKDRCLLPRPAIMTSKPPGEHPRSRTPGGPRAGREECLGLEQRPLTVTKLLVKLSAMRMEAAKLPPFTPGPLALKEPGCFIDHVGVIASGGKHGNLKNAAKKVKNDKDSGAKRVRRETLGGACRPEKKLPYRRGYSCTQIT
jgi:hypothetical protein